MDEDLNPSPTPAPAPATTPSERPQSSALREELDTTTSPPSHLQITNPLSLPLFTETSIPNARDPSLPSPTKPAAYVDVFMDDFIALAQGHDNRQRVRNLLLHAIDKVF